EPSPACLANGDPLRRERGRLEDPPFEYGLVFHFARDRGGDAVKGTPSPHGLWGHGDPGFRANVFPKGPLGNPTRYRYAVFYQEKKREAISLARVLRNFPAILEVARGVDICTDELGVPLWVFVPLVRHVQAAGDVASALLRTHGVTVPPLRLT